MEINIAAVRETADHAGVFLKLVKHKQAIKQEHRLDMI